MQAHVHMCCRSCTLNTSSPLILLLSQIIINTLPLAMATWLHCTLFKAFGLVKAFLFEGAEPYATLSVVHFFIVSATIEIYSMLLL